MESLNTLKSTGQQTFTNLVDRGKSQPDDVKKVGVTAAAGVAGALALTAGTKGIWAVMGILASPPVALTIGAVGGGLLGWNYMQNQNEAAADADFGTPLANSGDTATTETADAAE